MLKQQQIVPEDTGGRGVRQRSVQLHPAAFINVQIFLYITMH